jgi:hypothetical protein
VGKRKSIFCLLVTIPSQERGLLVHELKRISVNSNVNKEFLQIQKILQKIPPKYSAKKIPPKTNCPEKFQKKNLKKKEKKFQTISQDFENIQFPT